jgi:hypothetical protein
MATKGHDVVAGCFPHRAQAEQAVAELWKAGFPHDRIDMVTRTGEQVQASPNLHYQKDAGDGALAGAVAGAGAGAIVGAAALTLIPGVGTVIGGGLLAGLLGGAALGAAGGAFLGPFVALEMSEEDARYYAHAVDEGRTVVLVKTPDRRDEACAVLKKHGATRREAAGV